MRKAEPEWVLTSSSRSFWGGLEALGGSAGKQNLSAFIWSVANLPPVSGQAFCNTSALSMKRLMGDQDNCVYTPPRPLAVIDAELKLVTDGILEMIEWLRRGSSSSLTPIAPAKPCFPVRFCG